LTGTSTGSGSNEEHNDVSALNIENVISIAGTIIKTAASGTVANPLPSYFDEENLCVPYISFARYKLMMKSKMSGEFIVVLRYTKTTD